MSNEPQENRPRPSTRRPSHPRAAASRPGALLFTVALVALQLSPQLPAAADEGGSPAEPGAMAVSWNRRLLEIAAAEDHFLTLKGVRTAAMMHLAMHDALNAADRRYAQYRFGEGWPGAEPRAAAAQAAYEVAVSAYPGQRGALDAERDRWLEPIAQGVAKRAGRELGRAAAAAILAARQGDGWDTEVSYEFRPAAPGVYAEFCEHSGTPQGFVFGTGWAKARPFLLERVDQFRVEPPPAITSQAYARAFAEVKELGRTESATRTADQAHLALWWKDFAESSMNRLARQLVPAEGLDLWQATRLFALLNAGIFDSYVSVFENKFHYNHWRPYTAIRGAADDGNPATAAEPDWDNLHHHTYAFPSYPSAHGTVCAAAMTVFADTFGEDYPFTMTTREVSSAGPMSAMMAMDPPTRSFPDPYSAAMECAMSRVYLGIHFRYDSEVGYRLGRRIGDYARQRYLRPAGTAGATGGGGGGGG